MTAGSVDEAPAPRLPFVEGVRGVAALVVCLSHLLYQVPSWAPVDDIRQADALQVVLWPFRFGYEMVCLFLIVSGFSLHYSERQRESRSGRRSPYWTFLRRRGWRLAPLYYASLALGLAVIVALPSPVLRPGYEAQAQATPDAVLAHLLFVQNARPEWLLQVNAPLWSLAYEAQLYLVFPLIYRALRGRRPVVGLIALAVAAKLVGWAHPPLPLFALGRWFLVGAVVAELWSRGVRFPRFLLLVGVAGLAVGLVRVPALSSGFRHDAVWMAAFVPLLMVALRRPDATQNPFNWRAVRWLGLRSYSLYVVHFPVVLVSLLVVEKLGLTGAGGALMDVALGLPVALGLSMVAYRWIERPSLDRARRVAVTAP